MKTHTLLLAISLTLAICVLPVRAQEPATVDAISLSKGGGSNSVEAEIVALEKMAFEAWKNKDKKFFEEHMWEDGQYLDPNGVGGKAQYVQVIIDNNCTVNSYSLDKTKVTMLSKDSALLTYGYTYDIVCGGKPEAGPLWASTVYVKRGGKWLIAFHQEIPAAQAK